MKRHREGICLGLIFLVAFLAFAGVVAAAEPPSDLPPFPRPTDTYNDQDIPDLWQRLVGRAAAEPFNLVATVIFLLAICHTFLASKFLSIAHQYEHRYDALEGEEAQAGETSGVARKRDRLRFKATLFHFLGEIEAVFGIWAIPLAIAIVAFKGWKTMVHYFDGVEYTEPIFVFVIMAIASSRPVLRFAEDCLALFAALGGKTPAAWWLSILTVGPLLGSFITEPAAMTICALLLVDRFYKLQPSMNLRYATLGLLFVNISVGGTLTHFAAPPVVMVAGKWDWGMGYMFMKFGWKAILGILVANALFFAAFRKELLSMKARADATDDAGPPIPPFITIGHLLAISWTVVNAHYPALVVFGLLFFLAFVVATERHQNVINLRSPMLVGFFLAALVIHGGCQRWWIAPVLGDLTKWPLMIGSVLLTAFNDNAAITYLATLVPGFTEELKFAVVAGAIAGGGLTVIANAPNPAGQSILQSQFEDGGISPLKLLLGAIIPTIIMGAAFMLLPSL
ncbi:MAG TPA: putative Na+/H+ antiporter [Terrimicrobiaceae bacterium]